MKNKNTQVQEAHYAQIKQIQLNTLPLACCDETAEHHLKRDFQRCKKENNKFIFKLMKYGHKPSGLRQHTTVSMARVK